MDAFDFKKLLQFSGVWVWNLFIEAGVKGWDTDPIAESEVVPVEPLDLGPCPWELAFEFWSQ